MIVYPAVDLKDGQAVRLRQGDPARPLFRQDRPVDVARRWVDEGAEWLHVIDLDGAMAGAPRHLDIVERICSEARIPVQVGGGLRSLADLRALFAAGAARAILGTAALEGEVLRAALATFADRVAVALDVRDGMVAVEGWQRTSAIPVGDAARRLTREGVARFIYTDVVRDGMLTGPNLEGLQRLLDLVDVPVIASGGISTARDLRSAAAIGAEGAVVGRALYEGRLSLRQALAAAGPRDITRTGGSGCWPSG
jgi:phosphoribosylformimino-5-aminoimidazole carboxamide ribotide isomerase